MGIDLVFPSNNLTGLTIHRYMFKIKWNTVLFRKFLINMSTRGLNPEVSFNRKDANLLNTSSPVYRTSLVLVSSSMQLSHYYHHNQIEESCIFYYVQYPECLEHSTVH